MTRLFIFVAVCLATASTALGQDVRPDSAQTPALRPLARLEGRRILAVIPTIDTESELETDCSHLVHHVYGQAGFPYEYLTSRELYIGSTNFTRVRSPQAGDLVVWPGHVGIVIDSKQHSFFSFVRSGPDTQFYDSSYWRSRGIARFYRYVTDKPIRAGRTLEAVDHADYQPLPGDGRIAKIPPSSKLSTAATGQRSNPFSAVDTASPIVKPPREAILQVAGKKPSAEEIAAAFVDMNQDSGETLRVRLLNGFGRPVVVYREVRVSAMKIKGKRGTALLRIESLADSKDVQTGAPLRWKEQPLEFEKTKRGWVMNPIQDVAYVKREIAVRVLSTRLAELAENTDTIPKEREQQKIMRLLNLLVSDDSSAAWSK
jgi:NlpC/P60 family